VTLARNLMSDDEWAFFEGFIRAVRHPNGRKPADHRLVLDGIFWIARTGVPWRDLPEEFGKWSSVYRQFRRWTLAGLWENVLDGLNHAGLAPDKLQMVDSTVIRAHDPNAKEPQGGRHDDLYAAQHGRALLQQVEKQPSPGNPLRQNRRQFPRLHRHRLHQALAPPFVNMT